MGVKIIDTMSVGLTNTLTRTTGATRKVLSDGTEAVVKMARQMAPVDEGNLEEAIKSETTRSGIRGRNVHVVYVDEDAEISGRPGKRVGDYALLQHENLEPYGPWHLGPKSREKQSANPNVVVGGGYIERAAQEVTPDIMKAMTAALAKAVR